MKKDYESLLDQSEQLYEKRIYKSRKRSGKALILYIILLLLSIVACFTNGFTPDRLIVIGIFVFCIFISVRNKRIINKTKDNVSFKTEYMEDMDNNSEDGYIDNDSYISENDGDDDTRDL